MKNDILLSIFPTVSVKRRFFSIACIFNCYFTELVYLYSLSMTEQCTATLTLKLAKLICYLQIIL